MGVDKFLKKVPKNIREKNIKYKEFPDEIHNSVGLPTYKWALGAIFRNWYVKEGYFGSAEALRIHYAQVQNQYGSVFNIPLTVLSYTHYTIQKNDKEIENMETVLKELNPNALVLFNTYRAGKLVSDKNYEKAENLLKDALVINPNNFNSYDLLAKIKMEEGNLTEANMNIDKAIALAKAQNARQWQLNELLETKAEVDSM